MFSKVCQYYILLLIVFPLAFLLVACIPPISNETAIPSISPQTVDVTNNNSDALSIFATWTPLPTIQPRPDFVREVVPPESISIPQVIYQYQRPGVTTFGLVDLEDAWLYGFRSEICADIDLGELVQPGDNFAANAETQERFQLIIDGIEISAEMGNGLGGAVLALDSLTNPTMTWEHYSKFCWIVPLEVGTHQINLQFQPTSGDIQAYSWQFALTKELPPSIQANSRILSANGPMPLPLVEPIPTSIAEPAFIQSVFPKPGEILPLSYFDNELCVEVKYEEIFKDERYDTDFFNKHLTVSINGSRISATQFATILEDNATPRAVEPIVTVSRMISTGEDGQDKIVSIRKCWQEVALLPGMYEAHVTWDGSIEEALEYQWLFAIAVEE